MAANLKPIFIKQGNFTVARMAAANTASDGSGTLVTVVTAATEEYTNPTFAVRTITTSTS